MTGQMPREKSGKNEARPVLIVLHGTDSSPGRIGQVLRARGYPLDIRKPRFGDKLPETLKHHAGAVIFGGPMSANDPDDYIKREIDWIGIALKEERPFLGVCLGAQMLAKHLGACVGCHPEEWVEIGYCPVTPTDAGNVYGPWPDKVYHWHREGFEIPSGGVALAEGPTFANQAMAYGKAALGVQFHPEITYALVSRWTYDASWRLGQKGAQSREAQLVGHMLHGADVMNWLDRFIGQWLGSASRPRLQHHGRADLTREPQPELAMCPAAIAE